MAGSQSNGAVMQFPGATPQEVDVVEKIVTRMCLWEQSVGVSFHKKCQRFYDQYRSFTRWNHEWVKAGPNDKDGYIAEAKKKWGADLHIPLSFKTVETVVPRAIANAPKLVYLPRDEVWRENVLAVQMLIDAQQEQIDIDLPFQAVMRSGQLYGLGVGKTYWDRKARMRRRMVPRMVPLDEAAAQRQGQDSHTHVLGDAQPDVYFDDPRFEDVDIFDFAWDWRGYDMNTCDWTAHRMWLSIEGVIERLAQNGGPWDAPSVANLTEEEIRRLPNGDQRYTEIWSERMRASGFELHHPAAEGEQVHEVIEYHDGEYVYTVLDRAVLVKVCENPCGEMPFQIYRPIPLQHQMIGIGALEPLEHLQREIDTLRSQRRDLVTLALCAGYAYDAAVVDPDDLQFGPASAIPVEGDPRAALMPLGVKEVPGAGWQEEAAILANIADVAGLTDASDNSPSGQTNTTATEAQLVQAALGRRIELGARRFEIEVVRHTARQFLYLDQREIRKARSLIQPGAEPEPLDPEAARYKWVKIGPGELEGEYEIVVEGGSMAARNVPQDRADAVALLQNFSHDWFINPTKPRMRALELFGIKHPEAWLRSQQPTVPLAALRMMIQGGADPALIARSVIAARTAEAPEEGPSADQVVAMSGQAQQ